MAHSIFFSESVMAKKVASVSLSLSHHVLIKSFSISVDRSKQWSPHASARIRVSHILYKFSAAGTSWAMGWLIFILKDSTLGSNELFTLLCSVNSKFMLVSQCRVELTSLFMLSQKLNV